MTMTTPTLSLLEHIPKAMATRAEAQSMAVGDAPRLTSANAKKLEKKLRTWVGKAIVDYQMIADGDLVMVAVSGGKDSLTLLHILNQLKRYAPVRFDVIAVNLDQGQPGFPKAVLPAYFATIEGLRWHIVEEDTYRIVKANTAAGKTMCRLCSRLRRGILYHTAKTLGANKIALGHHRDDIVETLFLNLVFAGKLKAMPAKLRSDDGQHVVIRPLAYCAEHAIARYAQYKQFPIIPCNVCGNQNQLQRQKIKHMLEDWERQFPGRSQAIFNALQNVVPSHLADHALFDFRQV